MANANNKVVLVSGTVTYSQIKKQREDNFGNMVYKLTMKDPQFVAGPGATPEDAEALAGKVYTSKAEATPGAILFDATSKGKFLSFVDGATGEEFAPEGDFVEGTKVQVAMKFLQATQKGYKDAWALQAIMVQDASAVEYRDSFNPASLFGLTD